MMREGLTLFRESDDPFFRSLGLGIAALVFSAFFANLFGDRWMYQQITAYMWTIMALVCRARVILQSHAPTQIHGATATGIPDTRTEPSLAFSRSNDGGEDAA
jgi:uncharacterized membrane protein YjjP (DUF1212 family)